MSFDQYTEAFLNGNLERDARRADCEIEFSKLKKLIMENKIIVAKRGTKAFGKLNILPLFCEIFSEKFSYYLEKFPTIKKDLYNFGVTENLTEMLTDKFMCYDFSELIYKVYNLHSLKLDQAVWSTQNIEDKSQSKKLVEFLHLIYEITHFFSKGQILEKGLDFDDHHRVNDRREQIDWCAYCFRRVKSIGKQRPLQVLANLHDQRFPEIKSRKNVQLLCERHKSSKENDSFYRSARKNAKSMSEEDRQYIDQIHSERRLYEVVNFNKPVDHKMTTEQWEMSKSKWLGYLSELCPYIADLSDINSWDEFTTKFHLLLDNEFEDTQVPLFIEDIYMEAKIWIELQRNHYKNDKRRKSL
ncbi:hypothetical protein [Acinetobacter sp. DSM 11652]|uniref:hypothetical protein n=1 Tax=Acinetobacter sp. DSM 11652 TaxID=346222 RepID=UPI0008BB5561|nr:hypothetical protein [Acinetobacter sp. DSM 11652]SEL34801.1 hypothetical protein SAMN05216500_101464 [Acinetobacter sp. DSM 11652]